MDVVTLPTPTARLPLAFVLLIGASAGCGEGAGDSPTSGPSTSTLTATDTLTAGTDSSETMGDGDGEPGGSDSTPGTGDGDGEPSTATTTSTGPGDGDGEGDGDGDPGTGDGDGEPGTSTGDGDGDPPPLGDACPGYATRFWDCCKPHCGWEENVPPNTTPVGTCNASNQSHGNDWGVTNSCQQQTQGAAYTCFDMAPWQVNESLSYGFAAVPADGDICGRCYQLEFSGTGHNLPDDPGSVALGGKTMIVQAVNIGFDVGGGQFDVLIPGGGVGAFDACSSQWNVQPNELGATYGGFLTACQQNNGGNWAQTKQCVLDRCNAVFDEPGHDDLIAGCEWFVGWYEAADNPNLQYQEVACPQAIVDVSGIERPQEDIEGCGGGDGPCSQEQMDMCDCSWTNNGQNCGPDDGSCCWEACCA